MAVEERSGGTGMLWFGRQEAKGMQITADPTPKATEKGKGDKGAGHIIHNRFPFTQLGLDLASEQAESASITGRDASSKRAGGQLWGEGPIGIEIIPNMLAHFLRPIFNFDPTSVDDWDTKIEAVTEYDDTTKKTTLKDRPAKIVIPAAGLSDDDEVKVIGERRIGLPKDEVEPVVRTYTVENGSENFSTDVFFDSYTSLTIEGKEVTRSDVTYDTETYKTSFNNFATSLSDGLTVMKRVGIAPVTASDVFFNNTTISIGDTIEMIIDCICGPIRNYRAVNTGTTEKVSFHKDAEGTMLDDDIGDWLSDTHYPIPDLDFSPAWGSVFRFDDDIVDMISSELQLNLNLESRQSYRGSRYRNRPRKSATPRQVYCRPRVFFESPDTAGEAFNNWQQVYIDNSLSPLKMEMYNWLDNGKQYQIVFTMGSGDGTGGQLTAVPSLAIDNPGDIERDLEFLAIQSGGVSELSVEIYASKYEE